MSLEIIGRLCHYYHRVDRIIYESILQQVPIEISAAMRDPAVGIVNLLRNMRDVLNAINANNKNIKSLPISQFALSTNWLPNNVEKTFETSGFLDICKEYMCFSVAKDDKLIRFQFSNIRRLHFATEAVSLQVSLFFSIVFCSLMLSNLADSVGFMPRQAKRAAFSEGTCTSREMPIDDIFLWW
jgi:hypothetical protein